MSNRCCRLLIRGLAPLALNVLLTIGLTSCADEDTGAPKNPAPALALVSPDRLPVGSPALELSLVGDGFIDGSVVRWNGTPKATEYLDGHSLRATIPAADLLVAGTAEVLVFNPGPGGGTSETRTILLVAANAPVPEVSSLSPSTVTAGQAFTLEVRGAAFAPTSAVNWAGQPRITTYVSDSTLRADITAADAAQAGVYPVTVLTPPPGGGTSAALDFVVTVAAPPVQRVLFMGNSLTYVNLLPEMVDSLAAASGLRIQSTMMASPSYALVDHWDIPARRTQVQNGHYDVVIMQQGPSSLPESRVLLIEGVRLWDPVIRAAGGRPALYAVWPEKARFNVFADVSESYRLAAEDVDGLFFPVGDTWLETWARQPGAPLYGPDDFHPSVAGTYAAAVVIVSILADRDPESLASRFTPPPAIGAGPDSTLATTIRAAAGTVIERLKARRGGVLPGEAAAGRSGDDSRDPGPGRRPPGSITGR